MNRKRRWTGRWTAAAGCAALGFAHATSSAPQTQPGPQGTAARLIEHFRMQRIPEEGPWYSRSYASADAFDGASLPLRYDGRPHLAGSAILLVETAVDFSALHRLRTDETWHFYGGSPIDLLLLYPDGHGRIVTLGPDVLAGEFAQFTVPQDVWQGSAPRGRSPTAYAFAGDQLSPGFDAADFEMGYRDALQRAYPAFARDIARLTREPYARRPNAPTAADAPTVPAAPTGSIFAATDVTVQCPAAGVELQELVGAVAPTATSARLSVGRFNLAPGHGSGTSFNHLSEEVFVVTSGSGYVHLDGQTARIAAGSTVFIPATVPHSIESDADSALTFLAISAPAFTADDYVAVEPPAAAPSNGSRCPLTP